MKSILVLVLAVGFAFSSLVMAGDLSSPSSSVSTTNELSYSEFNFLFNDNGIDQTEATAISDQEMQDTQGQYHTSLSCTILNRCVCTQGCTWIQQMIHCGCL